MQHQQQQGWYQQEKETSKDTTKAMADVHTSANLPALQVTGASTAASWQLAADHPYPLKGIDPQDPNDANEPTTSLFCHSDFSSNIGTDTGMVAYHRSLNGRSAIRGRHATSASSTNNGNSFALLSDSFSSSHPSSST